MAIPEIERSLPLVVPAKSTDCTTGIPFGHHVASFLAMTWKFYPVLFWWYGPGRPQGSPLRET